MAIRRIVRRQNRPNGDAGIPTPTEGSPNNDARTDGGNSEPVASDGSPEQPTIIAGFEAIEPDDVGAGDIPGAIPKRRGRPKGSRNTGATPSQKAANSLESLNALLFSLHAMGAVFLDTPELALSEDESKRLSEAITRVAAFYNVAASDKALAWANLAMCGVTVYGKRISAIVRKPREKKGPVRMMPSPQVASQPAPTKPAPGGAPTNGAPMPGGLAPSDLFRMPPIDGGEG